MKRNSYIFFTLDFKVAGDVLEIQAELLFVFVYGLLFHMGAI